MAFPKRLRETRERMHLNMGDFCYKVGCHYNTLYRWETGAGVPDVASCLLLANALDCTLSWLILGQGEPPTPPPPRAHHPKVPLPLSWKQAIRDFARGQQLAAFEELEAAEDPWQQPPEKEIVPLK